MYGCLGRSIEFRTRLTWMFSAVLTEKRLTRVVIPRGQVLKPRVPLDERHLDHVGGTVALFGDDEFGDAVEVGIVFLVHLFAEDEGHHVGVLLDGADRKSVV